MSVGNFFQCVGEAVAAQGFKGLVKMVPFGEQLYDIAADALKRYRDRRLIRADVEALVNASMAEVKQQAGEVAARITPNPDERDALAAYLVQIPAAARRSLRRADDPGGTTLPAALTFDRPEDLLPLLPPRPPRFRPGDRPEAIGGWVLKELLGCGGFGEVWRAHHPDFEATEAAFKFCLDPAAQDRLLRHEAKVLNQVMGQRRHPGIVPLLDARLDTDPAWLKYEYVAGGDLTGVLRDWKPLADGDRVGRANGMIARLAEIVGDFHRLSPAVVHRDLKPSNILVEAVETRTSSQEVRPRVADFGIGGVSASRTLEQTRHSSGGADLGASLRGSHTPLYASPQQRKGGAPDARDDVFSLAIIWYQMLLGDPGAERPGGPGWKRRLGAMGVAAAQIDFLELCWDDDLTSRPGDASHLAEEVRRKFSGAAQAPVTAPPPPPVEPPPPVAPTRPPATTQGAPAKPRRPGHAVTVALPPVKAAGFLGIRSSVVPVELTFAWAPPGTAQMGSPETEPRRDADEKPHRVTLTRGFFLGIHPVTVGQFRSFVQATGYKTVAERTGGGYWWNGDRWVQDAKTGWFFPGFRQTDDHPVTCVAYADAEGFCKWLADHTGKPVRLPTEAEWEYACRAGTTTPFAFGATISPDQANYNGSYSYDGGPKGVFRQATTPVGSFRPNAWGLFDMHGNVWEWCADEYGPYPAEPAIDPVGRYLDESRVLRGGDWLHGPSNCRSAKRISEEASDYVGADKRSASQKKAERERGGSDRCSIVGFRVAFSEE